jgi:hypothetical protein
MRQRDPAHVRRIAPALFDAGRERHRRRLERIREDHRAVESARAQGRDALPHRRLPGDHLLEDAGGLEEGGHVRRRRHGDAALAAEAMLERLECREGQYIVPDPVEADHDRFTLHRLLSLPSTSSGRASKARDRGAPECAARSRH